MGAEVQVWITSLKAVPFYSLGSHCYKKPCTLSGPTQILPLELVRDNTLQARSSLLGLMVSAWWSSHDLNNEFKSIK